MRTGLTSQEEIHASMLRYRRHSKIDYKHSAQARLVVSDVLHMFFALACYAS